MEDVEEQGRLKEPKRAVNVKKMASRAVESQRAREGHMVSLTKNFFDRNKLYLKSAVEYKQARPRNVAAKACVTTESKGRRSSLMLL